MRSISELTVIIEEELSKIKYPKHPKLLYTPIEYIMRMKGKRIRSVLLLMAHQIFNKHLENAIPAALAIEVFHNFTLLHDDIMDKARLRRGEQTVHERWNENVAILSGDTMLIQSYQLMSNIDSIVFNKVMNVFNKAAIRVCEGQRLDIDFETNNAVSILEYLEMIEYKTGVLLAASLKIGAITGRANTSCQDHLYEFGKNIGIGFQLRDDLLDAFGNPESFGKKLGGDILANKKTYLYLKALEIANTKQKKELIHYYSTKDTVENKIKNVQDIFSELQIPDHTIKLIKEFHMKAIKHLDFIKSKNKEPLITFSNMLIERIN